jgi:hypothetical protein
LAATVHVPDPKMLTLNPDLARKQPGRREVVRKYAWTIGLLLYGASFFMPAVRTDGTRVSGYLCAWATLAFKAGWFGFACGMTNVLLVICVGLRLLGANPGVRRVMATITLGLLPVSWAFMAQNNLGADAGHAAWVVGILLMLGWDAMPEVV